MDTHLHRKIKRQCTFPRDGQHHWILTGSAIIHLELIGESHTTRRAAYAAFRAPVPANFDVVQTCGVKHCINPEHAKLEPTRRIARALDLSLHLETLAKSDRYMPPETPDSLPKDLKLEEVHLVKYLTSQNNTIDQIRAATGLPTQVIMRIRSGVYDEVARKLERRLEEKRAGRGGKMAKNSVDVFSVTHGGVARVEQSEEPRAPLDESSLSEEDLAWLRQIGRG